MVLGVFIPRCVICDKKYGFLENHKCSKYAEKKYQKIIDQVEKIDKTRTYSDRLEESEKLLMESELCQ